VSSERSNLITPPNAGAALGAGEGGSAGLTAANTFTEESHRRPVPGRVAMTSSHATGALIAWRFLHPWRGLDPQRFSRAYVLRRKDENGYDASALVRCKKGLEKNSGDAMKSGIDHPRGAVRHRAAQGVPYLKPGIASFPRTWRCGSGKRVFAWAGDALVFAGAAMPAEQSWPGRGRRRVR